MNLHKHARLSPRGRALLVDRILIQGLRVEEAAHAAGVSVRTAYKWLKRFHEEGADGLVDRSSRPRNCPHATPNAVVEQVLEHRRARLTYRQIAQQLTVAPSTIARLLRRAGLHRLAELEPAPPANRYEYAKPGQLLHLDIKKLGRFRNPATASQATARSLPTASAGSTSIWTSTTILASPSAASSPTSAASVPAARCFWRFATIGHWAFASNASSPTTAPATNPDASAGSSGVWACAICAHDPTPRAPTAKPSAWCRPAYVSGPTLGLTTAPTAGPLPSSIGCITTTGIGLMPASVITRPSPGYR